MKKLSIVLALSGAVACTQAAESPNHDHAKAEHAAAPAKDAKAEAKKDGLFGAPLTMKDADAVELAAVLTKPDDFTGKTVLINNAHVRKACSKKGCWMEISGSKDDKAEGCRVTFKDYGFFVPLDAAGSTARLQGTVGLKTVSKEDVDHLEAEGAKFARKLPDGSAKEVTVVATGVELTRASAVN